MHDKLNRKLHDLSTFDLLLNLPLSSDQKFQMDLLKQQIELLHEQIKILEQSLHARLLINDDIQRLLWIPGIGRILAFTIYLEVDGIERFPDVNKFYSYCRLVPGSNNSNKKIKHKSGNKDGNKYLKMAFTEASVRSVQYFKEIKQFHQSKARRKHKCIARNIVAGEIAKICYYVLKTKTDFNNTFKGITLSKRKTMQWPRLASPDV